MKREPMTLKQAQEFAPPTPKCFPDRVQWAAYLLHCQEFGKRALQRPFTEPKRQEPGKPPEAPRYRPEFDFCAECLPEHAHTMTGLGRCSPNQFRRVVPIAAAPAAAVEAVCS